MPPYPSRNLKFSFLVLRTQSKRVKVKFVRERLPGDPANRNRGWVESMHIAADRFDQASIKGYVFPDTDRVNYRAWLEQTKVNSEGTVFTSYYRNRPPERRFVDPSSPKSIHRAVQGREPFDRRFHRQKHLLTPRSAHRPSSAAAVALFFQFIQNRMKGRPLLLGLCEASGRNMTHDCRRAEGSERRSLHFTMHQKRQKSSKFIDLVK